MSAIVYREYTLLCDQEHCEEQFGPLEREFTRADVRKLAANRGWSHERSGYARRDDRDYCPKHAAERLAEQNADE